MPDMALQMTENGVDLRIENGDLLLSETLLEPVLVSLFSDARAPSSAEIPDGTDDPRGWWGEELGQNFGSLLWLLERSKFTQETAVLAAGYARESLRWMIEEQIASRVEVQATLETDELAGTQYLGIAIQLYRGASSAWALAWDATKEEDWTANRWRVNLLLR